MSNEKAKIDIPYGLDYRTKYSALYINGLLVREDVQVCDMDIIAALGHKDKDMSHDRVCQDWIEKREWKWPKQFRHVKFAEGI